MQTTKFINIAKTNAMKYQKELLIVIFAFLSFSVCAQKTETVEAEFTYYAPENVTLEEAKRSALEQAKLKAIADEFGMNMSQVLNSISKIQDGQSSSDFQSISESEVKGEWIETIGEPKYLIFYNDDQLVVSCKVKGKAREIVSASIDFKAKILRNGIEDKFEGKHFKDGDDLYLSFQSPVDGFLAVYLEGEDGQAYCLLPYSDQKDGIYPIKANKRYIFFDTESAPAKEKAMVDEYIMTTSSTTEFNQIYIIFSPREFTKAIDSDVKIQEALLRPRQLPRDEFLKWLAKCRKRDTKMNAMRVGITIEK
jgi:hypothetical protein